MPVPPPKPDSATLVRPFRGTDREAVRRICCDTGFLGNPIDPVFEDRELFADYLTRYYTDAEPESAFVVEKEGVVFGYLLGSRRCFRHDAFSVMNNGFIAVRAMMRYAGYNEETRKFIRWILSSARKETLPSPRGIPHFHFNIRREARSLSTMFELTGRYFEYLRRAGETHVFGQIVASGDRRSDRLFARRGFAVLNRSEVTKYRGVVSGRVFLCTVLKDLRDLEQRRA